MTDVKLQTFGVSLPPDVVEELDTIVKIEGVSRSLLVRWAVRDYLARRKSLFLPASPVETTNDIPERQAAE
jgi:metal-responsive CopG/Arc/MetJ family transcriptional regulator